MLDKTRSAGGDTNQPLLTSSGSIARSVDGERKSQNTERCEQDQG
jgi:hypothetical protein